MKLNACSKQSNLPLSLIGFIIAFLVWVVTLLVINRVFNLRIYQNFIKYAYNYKMGGFLHVY
ncbi:hypothetical protein D1166_28785 [Bacillus sp. ISO11]|nr:hypothetical protein D1166_28785 [Bacillus sp. ISO11]